MVGRARILPSRRATIDDDKHWLTSGQWHPVKHIN